jgi:hypothetical protein
MSFIVTTETAQHSYIVEQIEAPSKKWAQRLQRSLLVNCKGWEPDELRRTVAEPAQEQSR